MTTRSSMPKRIWTTPMASATEKKRPWKSKNGTAGKYSLRFRPKNDPKIRPKKTVDSAHSVANQAARRIVGSRKRRSMKSPARSRISP